MGMTLDTTQCSVVVMECCWTLLSVLFSGGDGDVVGLLSVLFSGGDGDVVGQCSQFCSVVVMGMLLDSALGSVQWW